MIISLIAALDETNRIGLQGQLPWKQSADLRRFKELTLGHHLIMGRKTYASIGKLLPGRITIVVTRNPAFQPESCREVPAPCRVAHSLPEALALAAEAGETEAFVIGGGEIFAQALPLATRLYLTLIHTQGPGDAYFPPLNPGEWQEQQARAYPADDRNQYPYTFKVLYRKSA